jgi:hypothetical protein
VSLLGPILVASAPRLFVSIWVGGRISAMTLDPERRKLLFRAKLSALVRASWGDVVDRGRHASLPGGATLLADDTLWVLAEESPGRSLGGALVLAARSGAHHLHLLASESTGALARRAERFRRPTTIWEVNGASLRPAQPEPLPPEPELPPAAEPYRALIEHAGAEAVVEAGVLRAEVRGLEVARVEVDESGAYLAVGVGKHDREASRMLHGDQQGFNELVSVVRFVAERRVPGGEGSPAYHLASERWLRWLVVRRPELVGAGKLVSAPSPVQRDDLRHPAPAPAAGEDDAGAPVLVVCSVGIDMDLVPAAADAWLADPRSPGVVLCVPEGDDPPAVRQLATLLDPPAQLRTVPADWRALAVDVEGAPSGR